MSKQIRLLIILVIGVALMACSLGVTPEAPTPPQPPAPTSPPALPPTPKGVLPTSAPSAPTAPPATSVPPTPVVVAPTPTTVVVAPAPIPAPAGLPATFYTDDRSTPLALVTSLFNAINRHEYLRAYSYWSDPAGSLGTLAAFSSGYANTAWVDLAFGQLTGSGGAGQIYYIVPVIIKGTATNGAKANYAACYELHMSQPSFQAAPPYIGLQIVKGQAHAVNASASDADTLAAACAGADYPSGETVDSSPASLADISKNNYLDNRSGPVEVVSSLENALNSKEYVRAYSYWENPASTAGPFNDYAAGFSDTDVITASFGTPISDAGAGQIHYKVPVALKVQTTSSTTQTFVGCYILHLSQPGFQAALPFQPIGIISGKFKKVDNSASTAPLLPTACS